MVPRAGRDILFFDKARLVLKRRITLYSGNEEKIHGHSAKDKGDIEINAAHHFGRSGHLQPQGGEQRIVCTLLKFRGFFPLQNGGKLYLKTVTNFSQHGPHFQDS
jgi:hypothetical protein